MSRFIHFAKKLRLIKKNKLTKWAPFWIIPKIHGQGRRVHPGRNTVQKRSWRRTKLKV